MGKSSENNKSNKTSSYTDFYYHFFRNILVVALLLLVISTLVLSLPHSSADSSSDTVKLSVPVSCTLSSHINTGEEHTISMVSGTYEDEIGITTLTTYCNDPGGFVIYANGNTDDIAGNNKLTSILGATYDIPSGTATSGDTSQWAMKLTAVNSSTPADTPTIATGYNSYSTVPNQWTKVVYKDAGTMNVETGSSFTTTYAIYLKGLQPAGTYSGQVKYVMLHPSTTGAPASTINEAFANANKTPVSVLDPETGQTGSFYKMQDMNSGICESVANSNESTTARLVDVRDNKLYYVTKLDDGHCWMTQNLDLDLGIKDTTLDIDTTVLTSNDTDLNDNSLSGAYKEGYNYDPNNRAISWGPKNTTRDYQNSTGTPWGNSYSVAYSLDPGSWYWDGDDSTPNCNYLNPSAGCTHFTQNATGANTHLAVGNYYNWSAAIASDDSSSLSSSTYSNVNLNPKNSICPKGWRLPTISNMAYTTPNSTSEFGRLNQLYNGGGNADPKLISTPLWFVRSGSVLYGSPSNPGSKAGYWSSTINNRDQYNYSYAYYMGFTATSVVPADNSHGVYGQSIRCVAR